MTQITDTSFSRVGKSSIIRSPSNQDALTGNDISYNPTTTLNEKIDSIIISSGGVTDHGALTGLTDDDHTQYTKSDGTRAFTGKISYSTHPTFSLDTELVDKKYVDDSVISSGGYTDEQAQDAVGNILTDSSTIDFTYNDAANSITAIVVNGSITTTKLGGDITTAGKALLDDVDASAQRTTLGLGTLATQNGTFSDKENVIISGTTSQYWRGDKSWQTLDKTAVGLSNVDNTSDATKNSSTATLTNKTLTTPVIGSIKGTIVADADGATITFDKNAGDYHRVVLGGDRTLAISNMGAGDRIIIDLVQDVTGSRTVTWFSTIKWVGGTTPTLTTAANKIDTFGFICTSTGNYQGYIIGQNL